MTENTELQERDLTTAEAGRLRELEDVIHKGLTTFFTVGMALKEIQGSRLYRYTHGTFEAYCKDTFEIAKSRAYQLLEASEVANNVHNCGQIGWEPKNEAQARALKDVDPEDLPEVCNLVRMWAKEKQVEITAALITRVVQAFSGEKAKEKIRQIRQQNNNTPALTGEFGQAFDKVFHYIDEFSQNGNLRSHRVAIIERLQAVIDAVAMDNSHAKSGKACIMQKTDREKLIEGGYRIFKKDTTKGYIAEYEYGEWVMYDDFIERPENMDAAFDKLMLEDKNLRG